MVDNTPITMESLLPAIPDNEGGLYGIFEGALLPYLWMEHESWGLTSVPLYAGNYQAIAPAIPYLVQLEKDKDTEAVERLLGEIGEQAMLLIQSPLSIAPLAEKLRYYYQVTTTDGRGALRRFYDPRHFANFITDLPGEQRRQLFDGIDAFYTEQSASQLKQFKRVGDKLSTQLFDLEVELQDTQL